ncbi:MAG TPA: sugar phosphate nucleotidyltransferase [Anaerolineales bacterium]|nr:sugar phosphate nucleotidyltransferase [Anaerolineales bacterium]
MKVIVPLAGFGTRLRPHTYSKPKPLVNVAGKPVLGHVLDMFAGIEVEEYIFITGYLGQQVESYLDRDYPHLRTRFYEQKTLNGQSPAVYLAKERIDGPVLIVFVDTLVETDLSILATETADAVAYVKPVEDPRSFGVAVLGEDGYVTKLIEKPDSIEHNLAVVGFYYMKDGKALMNAIGRQLKENIQTKGEFYLADAIQLMLADGMKMRVEPVEVWLDCGKSDTVLETNRYLLEHGKDNSAQTNANNSILIPPVYIHPSANIANSVIGPFVSIGADCNVQNAIIKNSILDKGAWVHDTLLAESIMGRNSRVTSRYRRFNVGDESEVGFD